MNDKSLFILYKQFYVRFLEFSRQKQVLHKILNSIWMVVTSDVDEDDPHRGEWAWRFLRFTSL